MLEFIPHLINRFKFSLSLLFLITTGTLIFAQDKNCDTIYPSATIEPFSLIPDEPVNFPLINPEPAGDINGDGKGDFIFGSYAADERTFLSSDNIYKSVITLDTGSNNNALVFYDKKLKGLGDYDGDGFDDVYDISNNIIYFGCADGISEDTLHLNFSEDYDEFGFPGDLNNDGKTEILIGKSTGSINSMLIFSGPDTIPFVIYPSWGSILSIDDTRTISYDFDGDNEVEFCLISRKYSDVLATRWYYLDKDNNQVTLEYHSDIDIIYDLSVHYCRTVSDINGDGYMDLTHAFYDTTQFPGLDLSVHFGLPDEPYFSSPQVIQVNNDGRLFYHAGDFNGDGADDWYSISTQDSLVIYYGNPDVLTSGFITEYYYMGDNRLMIPKSNMNSYWSTSDDTRLLYFNEDNIADIFYYFWSFDENLQFDFIGTAVILGSNDPDFSDPLVIGRSGNSSYRPLEYGFLSKNIGDINQDGFNDWGVLARSGCYLDIFFGGEEVDLQPDIKYVLPQTNFAKSYDWSVGDLNGDGWIDIVISNSSIEDVEAMRYYMSERDEIYIFFGEVSYQYFYNYEDADIILYDNQNTFREFGENLGVVGDYNADGYDDLVVGGGYNIACERDAFVYFGGEQIGPDPDLIIHFSGYS
jgi:hypothetical protein